MKNKGNSRLIAFMAACAMVFLAGGVVYFGAPQAVGILLKMAIESPRLLSGATLALLLLAIGLLIAAGKKRRRPL